MRSPFETIEAHGYDPRTTPIDTLMSAPVQMHLDVADAMENDDDYEQVTYG